MMNYTLQWILHRRMNLQYLDFSVRALIVVVGALASLSIARAQTLRVVSYNIDDADQGNDNNITASYAGLPSVIQAIGQHHLGTNAQPVDVLGVEELNATTLSNLATGLNNIYGAGTYNFDNTPDPTTGGGTDGLIYNTHTVQVISAAAIGSASTSGAARAPMRYQLRPVGYGPSADFYLYVSHYKASTGSTNISRRNAEATAIRQDADALGPNAHIIYSGDFNLTGASSEPAYATLTASGNGKAYDPVAASTSFISNWTNSNSSLTNLYSESTTTLNARFDFQLVSGAMLNKAGLQLAPDMSDPYTNNYPSKKYPYAYEVFGNDGSTSLNGLTNGSGNTSLSDLGNANTVLNDLMEPYSGNSNQFVGSDHLPLVADYMLVFPGDFNRDGHVNSADIIAMQQALPDLRGYETAKKLTDAQLSLIGDLNGDGIINNADLQSLLDLLKSGDGSADSVPEPASIALLGLGGLAIVFHRRSG
jgi:hypothetical protein